MPDTQSSSYTHYLEASEQRWWKRLLNVQAPYAWNIRRLQLGRMLDVGCGIGRNLVHNGGNGVGIDHNADSVATARRRGLTAFQTSEFAGSGLAVEGSFDSLLFAHVLEHMTRAEAVALVRDYARYVKPGGLVLLITPQEKGYTPDPTHVEFVDFDGLRAIAQAAGLTVERAYSFPFPRLLGPIFRHNEFVALCRKPR